MKPKIWKLPKLPLRHSWKPFAAATFRTMMTIHNTLCGVGDTASSYIAWYFGQFCRGTKLTPAEEEERYRQVTREDIIAAAKSMQPDTVYIMECKEQEAE